MAFTGHHVVIDVTSHVPGDVFLKEKYAFPKENKALFKDNQDLPNENQAFPPENNAFLRTLTLNPSHGP